MRGGKRPGAGRPKGTGIFKYGEPTTPVRVPRSLILIVRNFILKSLQAKRVGELDAFLESIGISKR